jgi:enterochelin esterase-like enzyme
MHPVLEALAYRHDEARDLRLDFLRGLAVIAMVVDHLAGPSALYLVTGGNRFFTSAAEIFVIVSGLVAGQVHGRIAERQSLGVALRRLLQRTWSLYLLTLGLTLMTVSIGMPGSDGGGQSSQRTPYEILWSILTLHQTAYLVDIMLLYTLLLLVAPVAVLLMHEGQTWIVLLGSCLLWGGYQLFPGQSEIPWPIAGNNLFHFAAWQVLFFAGLMLGYHRNRAAAVFPYSRQWPLLFASAAAFGALVFLFAAIQSVSDPLTQGESGLALVLQERVFSKGDLQIGRLAVSAIVFGFLFLSISRFWVPLRAGLGWLLLPLGQNALYAYSAHFALALALTMVAKHANFTFSGPPNALIQVGGVALIWLAIRFRVLFPTTAVRSWWMFAPVPLAVAMLLVLSREPLMTRPSLVPPEPAADDATRLARVFGTPVSLQQVRVSPGVQSSPAGTISPAPASTPSAQLKVSSPVRLVLTGDPAGSSAFADEIQARISGSFREQSFHSLALDRDMSYYAYLPAGYGADTRRYPVLYMLHGGSGSKDEWPAYGLVDTVNRLIASRDIRPLMVVFPQGDMGYWVNQANDGPRWGDYLAHDVVGRVDATFRTDAHRDHRAIGGLSMGGAGALQLAFNNPNLFRVVAAHSPSLHIDDGTFSIMGSGMEFARREPLKLAAEAEGIQALDIWIDAGDQDPWLERDQMLHQALVDRGIVHHWSVLNGGHEGPYWQRNLEMYLRTYDAALNRSET